MYKFKELKERYARVMSLFEGIDITFDFETEYQKPAKFKALERIEHLVVAGANIDKAEQLADKIIHQIFNK